MRLSTKVRYGSRALTELALAWPDSTVSIRDMAEKQNISSKYLEQITASLKAAGIAQAIRGMHGGYALRRPPGTITLLDVYMALEGSIAPVDCVDHPEACPLNDDCPTRETWVKMKDAMENVLRETSLQNLADRKRQKMALCQSTYQI